MAWDVKDITEASELSPFATRRRVDPPMAQEDPLAASSVFASRGSASETFAPELEEEDEVVDKLPGHALEEVLRPIDHEEEAELEEPETTYESTEEIWQPEAPVAEQENPTVAVLLGERDENKLTNMVFFNRHPGLDPKVKLKPDQAALINEWTKIRDTVVRPLLKKIKEGLILSPPFKGPYNPGFSTKASFTSCITVPDDLHVAVVDLTKPGTAFYAGIKDTDTTFAASVGKLAAMYAAFELRSRVREAITGIVPTTVPVATMVKNLQAAWQSQLDAKKPADAKAFKGFPKLTEIFDFKVVGGAWKVDFTSKGSIATLPSPEFATFAQLQNKFGFQQLLELMVKFSSDEASARCISALSYEYINAALVSAGFYEPTKNGIWLAAPYPHGKDPAVPERDRLWLPEPLMTESNSSRRFQVGSAKAFATMFTLIVREKLVDSQASRDMLALLDTGTNDFVKNALVADSRTVVMSRTKIGVIAGQYWAQVSFIRRDKKDGADPVQYVIAILNNKAPFLLDDAAVRLDKCVMAEHP